MKKEKVVCLFSGGIDSPTACALISKHFDIIPLHLYTFPYTRREMFDLVIESLKKVKEATKFEKAIVCRWADVMDVIVNKLDHKEYTCLVCKKGMFKAAEFLCEIENAKGIVTGECLGQKASQTLSNLSAISAGIKFPILRPLLCLDKSEIEKISKKLGVWQIRHAGGCKAVPKSPRTQSNARELDELFNALNLNELIQKSVKKRIELRTLEENLNSMFSG